MFLFSTKMLEGIVQKLLYAMLFVTPLLFSYGLYFPYISSKAYAFRFFIGVAFFFWAVLLMRSKIHRPHFKNLLVIGVLVFLAGYVITGLLGVDIMRSFFSTTERSDGVIQFALWTLYFLMATTVLRTRRDWQIALGIFMLAGFMSSVFGLVNIGTQLRLYGTLGNPSFLGAYLLFATGFAALFLLNNFSPFKNPLKPKVMMPLTVLMAFFVVIIVMTQTRGDYIGFLAGLLTFATIVHFCPGKSSRFKKCIIALDMALIALVIFLGFMFAHPNSSLVERSSLLKRVANSVETNSVQERLTEWKIALQGFKDRPIWGWGAENFISVSNKHYDYHVGLIDQWFDRPHNQTLQLLSEGGITLFAGYLLLVATIILFLYKIFKKEPLLASILGATLAAYYAQDFFLFDTFATHIGFFTLLGFIYYLHEQHYPTPSINQQKITVGARGTKELIVGAVTAAVVLGFIWYTVWIPYVSNPLVLEYNAAIDAKALTDADKILETSFSVTSPYLAFDIKKWAGWEILIKYLLYKDVQEADKPLVTLMYKKITPALADSIQKHPYEPQVYYVLGSIYRIGYEQLEQVDDLAKSEAVLKQGLTYSNMRIEYVDALSQTLLAEKKFDELEVLIKNFTSQIDKNDNYRYLSLGNYYYLLGKYDLAFEQYVKAQKYGYAFIDSIFDRDYDRYLEAAQATRNFEAAAEIIRLHLERKGPDAVNYFNLAVALIKMGKVEEARAAYQNAFKIDPAGYKQYERFFK